MAFLMEHMPWWLGGFLTSFLMAWMFIVNQHFKAPAKDLMVWRGYGLFLCMVGPACYYGWPTSPSFYLCAVIGGLLASCLDRMIFHASSLYGGGVVSRILPASIWVSFLAWTVLSSSYRHSLFENPLIAGAIVLCLIGTWIGISNMRKVALHRAAILYLLPAILMLAAVDVLFKLALTDEGIHGVFSLSAILALTVGLSQTLFMVSRKQSYDFKSIFTGQTLKAGLSLCVVMSFFPLTKNIAMGQTPNPAYITAMGLMAPIWVIVWNKFLKVQDEFRIVPLCLFLGSILGLTFLTA